LAKFQKKREQVSPYQYACVRILVQELRSASHPPLHLLFTCHCTAPGQEACCTRENKREAARGRGGEDEGAGQA
jgi:hypothetical protein